MKIVQCDPGAANLTRRDEIIAAMTEVVDSGWFILGNKVKKFEAEFAAFCGTSHALGVASGTDALELALRALDLPPGAKVATVSHTASATGAAIQRAGFEAVFVDIDADTFTMSPESLQATLNETDGIEAVIAVHLYGHPANLPEILKITRFRNIPLIEDCAQAHGASIDGKPVGSWGVMGCFSFYPTKNLGAIGDGGAIVTSDAAVYEHLLSLRQYGWKERFVSSERGINSRLDELQAAVLSVKLQDLQQSNTRRREIADIYTAGLKDLNLILPQTKPNCVHAFHQYVIQSGRRDELKAFLASRGVGTAIHYPQALHTQPAFAGCRYLSLKNTEAQLKAILSLPMYAELSDEMLNEVVAVLRDFK